MSTLQPKTGKGITPRMADGILLLVALLWGAGFGVTKAALSTMTAGQLIFVRFLIAWLALIIVYRKRLKQITKKIWLSGAVMGIFLTLGFLFQTYGMVGTNAGKAAFITGLNIVFVPFLAWAIYRRRPQGSALIAVVISLVGMALLTLTFDGSFLPATSDSMVFLCAIFFACHIVATDFFAQRIQPILLSIVQFTVGLVIIAIFTALGDGFAITLTPQGALSCIYLGLFPTCLAFLLQTVGQRYTTPTHASLILVLESVFGSISGALMLGERMNLQMMIGCALILCGIVVGEVFAKPISQISP